MDLQPKRSSCESGADADSLDRIVSFGIEEKIISEADAARLAAEAYSLTAGLARRRTGGKSSSLPEEAVRGIYGSLSYTIGACLCRRDLSNAAELLVRDGIDAARRRGRRVIERRLQRACFYTGAAQRNRIATDNETYTLTLMAALPGFFRIYDPVFAAQDRKIGCDYPTAVAVTGLCGIEFIEEYARRICFESCFCAAADGFFIRSACEFYAPDSRHAVFSVMEAAVEGLILGAFGIKIPAPGEKTSRADLMRVFLARVTASGSENYTEKAVGTVMRAAYAVADGVPVFPGDTSDAFTDYCRDAAKKTAPAILAVAGRCI